MPNPQPQDSPDYSGLPASGREDTQALDAVQAVAAWYRARIGAERAKPAPDTERIDRWTAALHATTTDRIRLVAADVEEQTEIGARYTALLAELRGR
ncbi:hypothetical protein [Streptomyces sp. NRRL B-24484]|uniref:hypothetical protein n=1 Tax=Streptomyces sp. NRRL B-24484 TaxID=1463833 RepID=UPI0004BEEC5F|nr:hypothetical protein [Streptomyces sp. NRRL B-24484]